MCDASIQRFLHFSSFFLLAGGVAACSAPAVTTTPDAAVPRDLNVLTVDALPDGPISTAWTDPPAAASPDGGSWRTSLMDCWTDPTCDRAMVVSHGGDWNAFTNPYDSRAAMVLAVQEGADGIKGDLRVTADNVAVVAHSSPIEVYESFDCQGQYIEKMTAAEVTACHLLGSKTQTYQRVDDLLNWAHGRTVVMLDVKVNTDLPRAITTGIETSSQDDLFLEVTTADFENIVVGSPGWEQIHYLMRLDSPADADLLIPQHHAQAFMYEMNPTYPDYDAAQMKTLIDTKLHPAGIRAFTSSDTTMPTVENHQMLFAEDFDVVMTYDLANALMVRIALNTMRGISPP